MANFKYNNVVVKIVDTDKERNINGKFILSSVKIRKLIKMVSFIT